MQDELVARLLTMTDPKTGARMVDAVYKRDEIYTGEFVECVRAAGRPGRRLPRVVAVNARRLAARPRLSEHEEVVAAITGRTTTNQTPGTLISSRPIPAGAVTAHHRYRADGVEVLRIDDSGRHRWQADLLSATGMPRSARSRRSTKVVRALRCFPCFVSFVSFVRDVLPDARIARAPRRSRGARPMRLQALQREADRLASEERTLLGDLAQARNRAADQSRGAQTNRRRHRPGAEGARRDRRRRRRAPEAVRRAQRPRAPGAGRRDLQAGPATRICACCSRLPISGSSVRHRAPSPHWPRSIASAWHVTSARSRNSKRRAHDARRTRAPTGGAPGDAAARADSHGSRGDRAQRFHHRHRSQTRRERAVVRRAADHAAEPAGHAARLVAAGAPPARQPLPLRPSAASSTGRSRGTVRRPVRQCRAGRCPTASKSPPPKGRRRPPSTTGTWRLRTLFRIRQSRDPGSRIANLQLVRRFARYCGQKGARVERGQTARHGRAHPLRRGRPLFRAARRRSTRGPVTMVEEKVQRSSLHGSEP